MKMKRVESALKRQGEMGYDCDGGRRVYSRTRGRRLLSIEGDKLREMREGGAYRVLKCSSSVVDLAKDSRDGN